MDGDDLDTGADDLRSAIMDAAKGSDTSGADPSPSRSDPQGDAPADKAVERARDATGKFSPKPAETPAPEAEKAVDPAAKPTETAPAAATRAAPQSWTADTKQAWASLPPAIQDQVLKRESETGRALEQSAGARRLASDMEQAMAPHRDLLARVGVPPAAAFGRLLEAHAALEKDAAGGLQQIAAGYGLNITGLQRAAGQPQTPPAAPQRQAPQPDVRQLVQSELATYHQQQSLASEIADFAKANPHFEAVKPAMARLVGAAAQAGEEMPLKDAYERAIWADPAIRTTLIAEQTAAVAAQAQPAVAQAQASADQARVARARQAAGSVRGAPSGTVAKQGERSLREELEANMSR